MHLEYEIKFKIFNYTFIVKEIYKIVKVLIVFDQNTFYCES
jgi:hypothetical protein